MRYLSILLLAGCIHRHAQRMDTPTVANETPRVMWCASGLSREGEELLGCATKQSSCERGVKQALDYGRLIGIAKVGGCELREVP